MATTELAPPLPVPGRRTLYVATLLLLVGYAVAAFTLVTVTTTQRPGSDGAAGIIFLGEGLAGALGFSASVLAVVTMVLRARAGAPFAVRSIIVLLAAVALVVLAPLLCLGYLVASTPFV